MIRWDDTKLRRILRIISNNAEYRQAIFSETGDRKTKNPEHHRAVFEVSIEFYQEEGPDCPYFTDMEVKGMMKKGLNGRWRKTKLWETKDQD